MNETLQKEDLIKQIELAKEAEKLNQQEPYNRPDKDRYLYLYRYKHDSYKVNEKYFNVLTSYITGNRHTSKKSLNELKPITLKQMMVPKVHHGFYLLCRTITKPKTLVGTMILIEDINHDVEELSLYNFIRLDDDNIENFLPIGTIMIIKEPYMKIGSIGNNVCIRCDSPSDVIFVDETDDILKNTNWKISLTDSFESLKSKANEYFRIKNYENAIKYYNRCLKIENNSIIYLNRSAAYLQMNKFYYAYDDAKLAFEMGANKEKSLYRMGKAAYGLRNWIKAKEHFENLKDLFPDNKDVSVELEKIKLRLDEEINGNYDLISLYYQSLTKNIKSIDVADYLGPVEIADIKGKGRGIIAKKDINAGTLLLVSKAFSYYSKLNESYKHTIFCCNLINNKMDDHTQVLNMIQTVQNLCDNPNRAKELYTLYAGDLDRSEKIDDKIIDISRIEKICSFNSFHPNQIYETFINNNDKSNSTGLWILPSFINHSCIVNAYRVFYKDIMMVYASHDIKKGEEIKFSYMYSFENYKKRVEVMKHYNFKCSCELCELDSNDSFYDMRSEMAKNEYEKIKSLITKNPLKALDKSIKLVNDLRNTYKNRNKYQIDLFLPLGLLAALYTKVGDYKKAISCLNETLEFFCDQACAVTPLPLIKIAECYKKLNKLKIAKNYLEKAIESNKIKMGTDENLFKIIYETELKDSNVYDLL